MSYRSHTGYTPGDTKPVTLTGLTGTAITVTDLVPDYADGSQVTDYATAFTVTTRPVSGGSATIALAEDPVLVEASAPTPTATNTPQPTPTPCGPDTDGDGMPDCYENLHSCLDPGIDDGGLDSDLDGPDGLTNFSEYVIGTDPCVNDTDADGCADGEDVWWGLDPTAWYDFYDVPVPANTDPTPNGPRNRVVNMGDVLAVLFYTFADDNGPPNANGVGYDSDKDGDTVEDGITYDRSPGLPPNPPWEAGLPNGVIDLGDALSALAQVGMDCTGAP